MARFTRRNVVGLCASLQVFYLCAATCRCRAEIVPDDPGSAAIRFTINSGQVVNAISPYIYGSNSSQITNRTFDRSGGNRLTGYNWETNASNAGADWYHHSDYDLARAGRPGILPISSARFPSTATMERFVFRRRCRWHRH